MNAAVPPGNAPNVDALKKVYLFATLTPQELKFLAGVIKKREFRSGHTVFREGDAAVSLFFVETGSVKVVKANPHGGDPIILSSLGPGTLFGEIPFVAGGARTANIMCTEFATTFEITYDELERLSQLNPQFGVKLYKALAAYLAKCLRQTTQEMAGPKPQVKAAAPRTGNTGFIQRPQPVAVPPQPQYAPQPQQFAPQPQYAPPQQPQYAPPQQPQYAPQPVPQAAPPRPVGRAPTQVPRPAAAPPRPGQPVMPQRPQGQMATQPQQFAPVPPPPQQYAPQPQYAPPQQQYAPEQPQYAPAPEQYAPQQPQGAPPAMGVGPTQEAPGARTTASGEIVIEMDE